jgi:hypothetical protein
MEGMPTAEAGSLPVARDVLAGGCSFEPVLEESPSPTVESFSLSFPPFLDFLEGCWPMERPRDDDEGEVELGPGDWDLVDLDSLKTESRE